MSDVIIARRYAQALKEEADGLGIIEKVDDDVALIRESLNASRDLLQFFESPVISREKKASVVSELFGERVEKTTLQFLLLMVEKRREHAFPEVVRAYMALRDEQRGVVNVSVRVARAMGEEEEKELIATIERMTRKSVRLDSSVDESLMGGLVVRIGDTVYDGSFSNQLQDLRERLETGHIAVTSETN